MAIYINRGKDFNLIQEAEEIIKSMDKYEQNILNLVKKHGNHINISILESQSNKMILTAFFLDKESKRDFSFHTIEVEANPTNLMMIANNIAANDFDKRIEDSMLTFIDKEFSI